VDNYRDLLSGVMDTHISTVSNRLNVVMKQLTIIATIFLPLSFLTGFFGQNFAWMITHITSLWVFLTFGIGLELATVVFLVGLFWKTGLARRADELIAGRLRPGWGPGEDLSGRPGPAGA